MTSPFEVSILSAEEVHSLPGIWPAEALRQLLVKAEIDDAKSIVESDLLEMALMALQDLGNQAAGELVLEIIFGDAMRSGVRQNLVDDLQETSPWDDFATVEQQRGLFIAVVLLHQAFPNRYGTPDALRLKFTVQALSEAGSTALAAATAPWLIRILSFGLSDSDVLHRLYEDDLRSGPFKDAPGLIWYCEADTATGSEGKPVKVRSLDMISSMLWFGTLGKRQTFRSHA